MHFSIVVKMNTIFVILAACFVAVQAAPESTQRIYEGSVATISQYPFASSLLYSRNLIGYYQRCCGTILTTRAILTAGHCVFGDSRLSWRVRTGSSFANSGGAVYLVASLLVNPGYNSATLDYDVAIMRTATAIVYQNNAVRPASIAGSNYNLADNSPVFAIGWGTTGVNGASSDQLRQVKVLTINQSICKSLYLEFGWTITDNMVCTGWLDAGHDQCPGDSGGPLVHNNVVVGICSVGTQCAVARYFGVSTRVSRFNTWIQVNAEMNA